MEDIIHAQKYRSRVNDS